MNGIGTGTDPVFDQRLVVFGVGVTAVFALFVMRLFQLQVVQGEEHFERSLRNSIRTVRLAAPRGEILDRAGRVLATTRPAFHLDVMPSDLREPDRTLAVLAALVDRPPSELRDAFGDPSGRARFQPVRVAQDLDWEALARVESHRYALPGVATDVRPRRHYPNGQLASHVLGTIGEISPEQLESRAGYRAGEQIGRSGVEALLEPQLRGYMGGRNVVVDVAGRVVEVLDEVEPRPGGQVVLTLDLDLQREAEAAFEPTEDGEIRTGAVVALDPRTGDVLALVSAPSFDPNAFAGGVDSATWRALTEHPERPLQNRAVAGQYPPGSTYKPFVALAALAERRITPATESFCPGSFRLGRRTYRCWRRAGHGHVDLRTALVRSCDVYFYRAGLQLGIDPLAAFVRGFGLGRATGIATGGEQAGLVPTRAWKERRFGEPWVAGETVSASIGQGYNLVTPLQLAVAYAVLANGGSAVRPRLVLASTARDGTIRRTTPEVVDRVELDAGHLERVRDALGDVVNAEDGTGRRARVEGVRVAGKTGTAQVVRLEHVEGMEDDEVPRRFRDHAWFAAFAPVEQAEIVVVVLLEHAGGGGANAAPVAQRVLARWWEKRGEPAGPPLREAALRPAGGGARGPR